MNSSNRSIWYVHGINKVTAYRCVKSVVKKYAAHVSHFVELSLANETQHRLLFTKQKHNLGLN